MCFVSGGTHAHTGHGRDRNLLDVRLEVANRTNFSSSPRNTRGFEPVLLLEKQSSSLLVSRSTQTEKGAQTKLPPRSGKYCAVQYPSATKPTAVASCERALHSLSNR